MNIKNLMETGGFINVNKPAGITSFDCIRRLRRILNIKKTGHMGTLDPAATGVLPVALGKATRLIEYLSGGNKGYRGVVRLGVITDTDDMEGEIIEKRDSAPISPESIEKALENFRGEVMQVPPKVSALKIKGQRAYKLAREGRAPDMKARPVTIHRIDVIDYSFPLLTLDVICGPGTYIRSIARELGEALGCGGALDSLVRTRSGLFTIDNSLSLEEIEEKSAADGFEDIIIDPVIVTRIMPFLIVNEDEKKRVSNGNTIELTFTSGVPELRPGLEIRTSSSLLTENGSKDSHTPAVKLYMEESGLEPIRDRAALIDSNDALIAIAAPEFEENLLRLSMEKVFIS